MLSVFIWTSLLNPFIIFYKHLLKILFSSDDFCSDNGFSDNCRTSVMTSISRSSESTSSEARSECWSVWATVSRSKLSLLTNTEKWTLQSWFLSCNPHLSDSKLTQKHQSRRQQREQGRGRRRFVCSWFWKEFQITIQWRKV